MIGDYEPHLTELDRTWAHWIATGNVDALRRRAYAAIAFALCSVHTPVAEGEREFAAFMDTGELPEGTMLADQKGRGLIEAQAWIATTTLETFAVDGWTLADTILRNVYGLGTAKSAFASALCGNPEPYCIDTHGAQLIADRDPHKGQREVLASIKADKARPSSIAASWRRSVRRRKFTTIRQVFLSRISSALPMSCGAGWRGRPEPWRRLNWIVEEPSGFQACTCGDNRQEWLLSCVPITCRWRHQPRRRRT